MLLDQTYLTTGYPELRFSKGRGAKIQLGYAEALYLKGNKGKGNRNEVEGKEFIGNHDVVIADGGARARFPAAVVAHLSLRGLTVETKDEPLAIDDLRGTYTGYPFERKARFDAGVKESTRFWISAGARRDSARMRPIMDCPYYEQLQYAGDTRIQSLVSMYMTGDGRLARNAIDLLITSRTSEGATFSRAPTRLQQYIPGFSLWWIGMVHDYWMYQDDPEFVKQMLPGVRAVLSFFAAWQKSNGSIGPMPWWNFVDWTKEWKGGAPGVDGEGSKAPADLQLLLAYQWAARLEEALGSKALAAEYRASARTASATMQKLYWDAGRKLYRGHCHKQRVFRSTRMRWRCWPE